MIPNEQPLQLSEQKAISRAARLSGRSRKRQEGIAISGSAETPVSHRRMAISRRARATAGVTIEQRLVTLFMD